LMLRVSVIREEICHPLASTLSRDTETQRKCHRGNSSFCFFSVSLSGGLALRGL
jgi:hypothetical protein